MKEYVVYILSNYTNRVLYVGVTNNLDRRMQEHKAGIGSRFCRRYGVKKLVYYECYISRLDAIHREKQLKAGSRAKKIVLIEKNNPEWRDLCE